MLDVTVLSWTVIPNLISSIETHKKDPKKDQTQKAQQKETNNVGRASHVSQKSEDKSRK